MTCRILSQISFRSALRGLPAIALLIAACSSSNSSDTDSKPSISELLMDQCPLISACLGISVNSCADELATEESYDHYSPYLQEGLILRGECLESAADCDAVQTCFNGAGMWTALEAESQGVECGAVEETRCEDDHLIWCFMGEYDESATPIAFDLSLSGMTCNSAGTAPVNPGHTPCESDPSGYDPEYCDGVYVSQCVNGELQQWDCRRVDPDFSCYYQDENSVECGIPPESADCELNTYNDQGDSGWCEGTVAVACVTGKAFRTDCAVLDEGTCALDTIDTWDGSVVTSASCVSPRLDPVEPW